MHLRHDIQLLRGYAVLIVVLFHLQAPLFRNGFLGVDIFFVISGFLMASLYDKGTVMGFYRKRLDRIFPAYAVTILITLALGCFLLIPVDFAQLLQQAIAGLFFASNVFYWNQNSYFDKAAFNPVLNFWSLAVEIQFYLIVPVLFPLIRTRRWLFLVVFLGSAGLCFAVQTVSPKTSFFLMPLRIWEFLIGAAVAWQRPFLAEGSRFLKPLQSGLILALLAFPFCIELKPDAVGTVLFGHPAVPALITVLLTGGIIKFGMPRALLESLPGRCLAKLGDYSYSVYLVHFPLLVLFNYSPFGGTRLAVDGLGALALICPIMAACAFLSYRGVERRFAGQPNRPALHAGLFCLVLVAGFVFNRLNLNQYRDQRQQHIFAAWSDRDTYRCGKGFRLLHPTEVACDLTGVAHGKNILLIGNSHADSIKKTFAEVGLAHGYSTYFLVPNDPLTDPRFGARELLEVVRQRRPDAVFLHFSNLYGNARFKREMWSFIDLVSQDDIRVVVIGPVPTYELPIPKAMFEDTGHTLSFATTLAQHRAKTQAYRAFAEQLADLGVAIYDPAPLLCPATGDCLFADRESRPFYFDAGHLTLTGAAVLKPLFQQSLEGIAQRPSRRSPIEH